MQQIGAFIEYDQNGKPYIGLLLQSDGLSLTYYFAHRQSARQRVQELSSHLHKLVKELEAMPDQLVAANGGDISALSIKGLREQSGG